MENGNDFKDLIASTPDDLSAKERILRTALILFNKNGIHTTGIEKIISESGVAKATFYKHFPSKTNLVRAYLEYKDVIWFRRFDQFTSGVSLSSLDRLLGIFDALEAWFSEPGFRGCPFIKGLTEFDPVVDPEVFECVSQHFVKTQRFVEDRLKEVVPNKAAEFAPKVMSLIAGATILAVATGNQESARMSKSMLKVLIEQAKSSDSLPAS